MVAGVGLFFSALMIGITSLQGRYTSFSPKSAEEFNSASRSIKPGLIAAGIVSAWTTAATFVSMISVLYLNVFSTKVGFCRSFRVAL